MITLEDLEDQYELVFGVAPTLDMMPPNEAIDLILEALSSGEPIENELEGVDPDTFDL